MPLLRRCGPVLLVGLALIAGVARAEPASEHLKVGLELQAYPAGLIPGLHLQLPVGDALSMSLRGAWNSTDRRDWGEHDDESGGGPGGGVGLWREFTAKGRVWQAGVRVDAWALEIDWRDDDPSRSGSTQVVVLQPTAAIGLLLHQSTRLQVDLSLSVGQEINVSTDGEEVGEGLIGLIGVRLLR